VRGSGDPQNDEDRNRVYGTREGWVSPRVIRAAEDIVGGVREERRRRRGTSSQL